MVSLQPRSPSTTKRIGKEGRVNQENDVRMNLVVVYLDELLDPEPNLNDELFHVNFVGHAHVIRLERRFKVAVVTETSHIVEFL